MKMFRTLFVLSAMMFLLARPSGAEPGQDTWREAMLKRGQGLTHLLAANSCGTDHLFAVMDRNNVSVRKLRTLDPARRYLIPSAEECAKPAEPRVARASREVILADVMNRTAREEANRRLLAANSQILAIETRLKEKDRVISEKDRAIHTLEERLRQSVPAKAPTSVQPAARTRSGVTAWMFLSTALLAFLVGGAGVKAFDHLRPDSWPWEKGYVRYRETIEVEMPDGTKHAFDFTGAAPSPGTEKPAIPLHGCRYCGRRDLRLREGTENPHFEFQEHIRKRHADLRVRVVEFA